MSFRASYPGATASGRALRPRRGLVQFVEQQLPVGTYHLVAAYVGSTDFHGSVSSAVTLTVVK